MRKKRQEGKQLPAPGQGLIPIPLQPQHQAQGSKECDCGIVPETVSEAIMVRRIVECQAGLAVRPRFVKSAEGERRAAGLAVRLHQHFRIVGCLCEGEQFPTNSQRGFVISTNAVVAASPTSEVNRGALSPV